MNVADEVQKFPPYSKELTDTVATMRSTDPDDVDEYDDLIDTLDESFTAITSVINRMALWSEEEFSKDSSIVYDLTDLADAFTVANNDIIEAHQLLDRGDIDIDEYENDVFNLVADCVAYMNEIYHSYTNIKQPQLF